MALIESSGETTMQGLSKKRKTLVFITLVASILWTYFSLNSVPQNGEDKEISLSAIPKYQIASQKDVIPYPRGTVFEEGMASYFYAVGPEMIVTPTVTIDGIETGLINGTIDSKVILRAVDDKAQIYWQYILVKNPSQAFTFSKRIAGMNDQLSFASKEIRLNIAAAYEKVIQIANNLLFQNGVFQIVFSADIYVQGTVNGIATEKNVQMILPLTLEQTAYNVPKALDAATVVTFSGSNIHTDTSQSILTVIREHLIQFTLNMILLLFYLILLLYDSRKQSKTEIYHKKYREWITEGSVEILDRHQQVNILNLEGLVDLAIDLNKRVIHDMDRARYYVLTQEIVYLFDPEQLKALHEGRKKLGKMLVELKLINIEQLEIGLYYHKKTGRRLGECLIAMGFVDETTLYCTLAAQQHIDYYELEEDRGLPIAEWSNRITIQKARTMVILPLGLRDDGKLVIACGEIYQEGLFDALKDIFGADIYIVSSRPSIINRILDRMDAKEKVLLNSVMNTQLVASSDRITQEERDQFHLEYHQGQIDLRLFLQASGLIEDVGALQTLEKEDIINWLTGNNIIETEILSLFKGLNGAVYSMARKLRQEKQCPNLLDILLNANYLTKATVELVERESASIGLPPEQLLINNFYTSSKTIDIIISMQNVLNEMLK